MRHPDNVRFAENAEAIARGANLLRVCAPQVSVCFSTGTFFAAIGPRDSLRVSRGIVVGADGRNSIVRIQAGNPANIAIQPHLHDRDGWS